MPKPPDNPTGKGANTSVENQAAAPVQSQPPAPDRAAAPAEQEAAPAAPPLPLNEDIARIIEEQVDVIVQKHGYHAQLFFGVSGIGSDPVNTRNSTLAIANALRSGNSQQIIYALTNLGDPQISQINDHTTPFRFNAQIAGILEGILIDAVAHAYSGDKARQRDSRMMLEQLFVEANEHAERQSKSMLLFQAPAPHPNARS